MALARARGVAEEVSYRLWRRVEEYRSRELEDKGLACSTYWRAWRHYLAKAAMQNKAIAGAFASAAEAQVQFARALAGVRAQIESEGTPTGRPSGESGDVGAPAAEVGVGPGSSSTARLRHQLADVYAQMSSVMRDVGTELHLELVEKVLAPMVASYAKECREVEEAGDILERVLTDADSAAGGVWDRYRQTVRGAEASTSRRARAAFGGPAGGVVSGGTGSGSGGASAASTTGGSASDSDEASNRSEDPWLGELRYARVVRGLLACRRAYLRGMGALFERFRTAETRRGKALGAAAELSAGVMRRWVDGAGVKTEALVSAARQLHTHGDFLTRVEEEAWTLHRAMSAERAASRLGASDDEGEEEGGFHSLSRTASAAAAAGAHGADPSTSEPSHSHPAFEPAPVSASGGTPVSHGAGATGSSGRSFLQFVGQAPADIPSPLLSPLVVRWGRAEMQSGGLFRRWKLVTLVLTVRGNLFVFDDEDDLATHRRFLESGASGGRWGGATTILQIEEARALRERGLPESAIPSTTSLAHLPHHRVADFLRPPGPEDAAAASGKDRTEGSDASSEAVAGGGARGAKAEVSRTATTESVGSGSGSEPEDGGAHRGTATGPAPLTSSPAKTLTGSSVSTVTVTPPTASHAPGAFAIDPMSTLRGAVKEAALRLGLNGSIFPPGRPFSGLGDVEDGDAPRRIREADKAPSLIIPLRGGVGKPVLTVRPELHETAWEAVATTPGFFMNSKVKGSFRCASQTDAMEWLMACTRVSDS